MTLFPSMPNEHFGIAGGKCGGKAWKIFGTSLRESRLRGGVVELVSIRYGIRWAMNVYAFGNSRTQLQCNSAVNMNTFSGIRASSSYSRLSWIVHFLQNLLVWRLLYWDFCLRNAHGVLQWFASLQLSGCWEAYPLRRPKHLVCCLKWLPLLFS